VTNKTSSLPTITSAPDLVRKEVLAALGTLAAVCLVSAWFDAPIEGPADPHGIPAEHVKAPWIFVGIQQMLRWWPPWSAGVLVPGAALFVLALIPFVPQRGSARSLIAAIFFALVFVACALTLWGYLS